MTQTLGVGDFVAWDGGCMLIGQAFKPTGVHSHYATQFSFGAADGIRCRTGEQAQWAGYDGALIASRQPHAMDATPVGISATMLIETETLAGRALAERAREGISNIKRGEFADAGASLFQTWKQHGYGEATQNAARVVINLVARVSPAT